MSRLPDIGLHLSFSAILENWVDGMDYCAVAVPAEITQRLKTHGPVRVTAVVNDSAPFQVSLFPVGGGRHCIRIKASVRQAEKIQAGDPVVVQITVLDPADVTISDDLTIALRAESVSDAFTLLPPGQQNFLLRRIA